MLAENFKEGLLELEYFKATPEVQGYFKKQNQR